MCRNKDVRGAGMKEIKLDLSNGKLNISEQLIEQGYRLSDKHEKMALSEIQLLKTYSKLGIMNEKYSKQRIANVMDFIIMNAKEVQE